MARDDSSTRAREICAARLLERGSRIADALGITMARLDRAEVELQTLAELIYGDALESLRPRAEWEERDTDRPPSGDQYPAVIDPEGTRFRDPRSR